MVGSSMKQITQQKQPKRYITIRIPASFDKPLLELVNEHGFSSKAEVTKEALKKLFEKYKVESLP